MSRWDTILEMDPIPYLKVFSSGGRGRLTATDVCDPQNFPDEMALLKQRLINVLSYWVTEGLIEPKTPGARTLANLMVKNGFVLDKRDKVRKVKKEIFKFKDDSSIKDVEVFPDEDDDYPDPGQWKQRE